MYNVISTIVKRINLNSSQPMRGITTLTFFKREYGFSRKVVPMQHSTF